MRRHDVMAQFLSAVSHDFRQPLHALGLFVAQLRSPLGVAERARVIEQIEAALAKIIHQFNALLDISRLDAGQLVPDINVFPLATLLVRAEDSIAETARQKGLELRIIPSALWVRSDAVLLERILMNLVSEAVRHTASGKVLLGCRRRGARVCIEVWDDGPGQLAEHCATVGGGTEPGLENFDSIVPEIVRRLCGLLGHEFAMPSPGSRQPRYSISVPWVLPPANPTVSGPHEFDASVGKLVAVIDDEPLVRDGMAGLLRNWGYRVMAANNPETALADLAATTWQPNLIISDFRLENGQSGIAAIDRMRDAFGRSIPAFLISADTGPELLRIARERGFQLLHKPVEPMTLRALLSHILADGTSKRG